MKAIADARKKIDNDVEEVLSNLNLHFEKLPKTAFAEERVYNISFDFNTSQIVITRENYHDTTPLLVVERCANIEALSKYASKLIEKVFEKLKDDPDVEIKGEGKFVTKPI